MDGRFNHHPFANDQDDSENSPENSADSPRSGMFHDGKMAASITSPKRSRRAIQKRVVSVPINDGEGSKPKGEISFPPSDSWAWRKYGQKPIKGSPYPRGYYRCSSSKGCPAKKQVERSRVDPNMLVVTYSCEHNHPWPAARNNNHAHRNNTNTISLNPVTVAAISAAPTTRSSSSSKVVLTTSSKPAAASAQPEVESDDKFTNLGGDSSSSLIETDDEFGWFSSFEPTTTSSTVVIETSSILAEDKVTFTDMFSMREDEDEEEESMFAGLGELPECSREFGIGMMERDETRRRHNLTPWCGTA